MLEDTVLVTEDDVRDKYVKQTKCPSEYKGMFPLTVKSLTTSPGKDFLNLATWVHFNGSLQYSYVPAIHGNKEQLEDITESYLNNFGCHFIGRNFPNSPFVYINRDSGFVGRILNSMGIYRCEKDTGRKRITKTHSVSCLPSFIQDINNSSPGEDEIEEKKDLVYSVIKIMFKDKYDIGSRRLLLNSRSSKKRCMKYGTQVIDLLNSIYLHRNKKNLFSVKQIQSYFSETQNTWPCYILLRDYQIGALTESKLHKRPIFGSVFID